MGAADLKYTLEEFYNVTEDMRAELIDGKIYYMSPAPNIMHQRISVKLTTKISNFIEKNKGNCEVFSAPTDVLFSDNTTVQPDIFVVCDKTKITEKRCEGAPDWIIEITSKNAAYDYVTKRDFYQQNGVREYWIVDPRNETVTVFNSNNNMPNIEYYKLNDIIPVGIYKDNPEPLEICIADLISEYVASPKND